MAEWKRVRDKRTGHEYSVVNVNDKFHEVIDKPAARNNGKPFPPKPKSEVAEEPEEVAEPVVANTASTPAQGPAPASAPNKAADNEKGEKK